MHGFTLDLDLVVHATGQWLRQWWRLSNSKQRFNRRYCGKILPWCYFDLETSKKFAWLQIKQPAKIRNLDDILNNIISWLPIHLA